MFDLWQIRILIIIFVCACSLPSSANTASGESLWQSHEPLMGTLFTVNIYAESAKKAKIACSSAFKEARKLEGVLSSRKPDSELSRLNQAPSNIPFSTEPMLLLALEKAIYYARQTNGAFDPTLGACMHLWRRTLTRKALPSQECLRQARASSGFSYLEIEPPFVVKRADGMKLDLGGIGKGIAVDLIAQHLKNAGFTRFCISSTSDVLAGDPPPGKTCWQVSLDGGSGNIIALVNSAVSTSGDKNQFVVINGKRYSHVLDPATGMGLENSRTITIKAKNATEADALATAFCILPRTSFCSVLERFPNISIVRDVE